MIHSNLVGKGVLILDFKGPYTVGDQDHPKLDFVGQAAHIVNVYRSEVDGLPRYDLGLSDGSIWVAVKSQYFRLIQNRVTSEAMIAGRIEGYPWG